MTRTLLMTAAALTLAIPVAAQAGGGRAVRLIEQADANKDGATSRQEFMDFRTAEFPSLDRNKDGVISAADVPPRYKKRVKAKVAEHADVMAGYDADKDGKVTRAEFDAAPTLIFDRFDTDHDGKVSRAEVNAALAAAG